MILHVLRHAKSSWDTPGLEDRERPLNARGEQAVGELAGHLRERRLRPSLALCSPALRARQTLEAVLPALPPDLELRFEERLYGAGADALLARLRRLPRRADEVLLVGHNPGLHDLILALAGRSLPAGLRENLPTAGLVTMEAPGAAWRELGTAGARVTASWRPPRGAGDPDRI